MEASKKPWLSKTVILNALGGVVAAIAAFYPPAAVVGTFISSHAAEIGMIWGILNIILRAVTKDKISLGE